MESDQDRADDWVNQRTTAAQRGRIIGPCVPVGSELRRDRGARYLVLLQITVNGGDASHVLG